MWWTVVGKAGIISLLLMGIVAGMLWLIKRLDGTWNPFFCRMEKGIWLVLILLHGIFILCLDVSWMESLLIAAFAGSLLVACITDIRIHQVYQMTWWIAGMAETGLFCLKIFQCREQWCSYTEMIGWGKGLLLLLLFGILQERFFCKMYGRADCHAFCSCAVAEWLFGMDIKMYLVHMLLAIVLLATVQLFCKNIDRKGNLMRPVPFLPYITLS